MAALTTPSALSIPTHSGSLQPFQSTFLLAPVPQDVDSVEQEDSMYRSNKSKPKPNSKSKSKSKSKSTSKSRSISKSKSRSKSRRKTDYKSNLNYAAGSQSLASDTHSVSRHGLGQFQQHLECIQAAITPELSQHIQLAAFMDVRKLKPAVFAMSPWKRRLVALEPDCLCIGTVGGRDTRMYILEVISLRNATVVPITDSLTNYTPTLIIHAMEWIKRGIRSTMPRNFTFKLDSIESLENWSACISAAIAHIAGSARCCDSGENSDTCTVTSQSSRKRSYRKKRHRQSHRHRRRPRRAVQLLPVLPPPGIATVRLVAHMKQLYTLGLTGFSDCLTEEDKLEASRTHSSLLYGEVLPEGLERLVDNNHLDARTASVAFDLGSGTGRLAMQLFLQFPNLRKVVGIELAYTRFDITAYAAAALASTVADAQHRKLAQPSSSETDGIPDAVPSASVADCCVHHPDFQHTFFQVTLSGNEEHDLSHILLETMPISELSDCDAGVVIGELPVYEDIPTQEDSQASRSAREEKCTDNHDTVQPGMSEPTAGTETDPAMHDDNKDFTGEDGDPIAIAPLDSVSSDTQSEGQSDDADELTAAASALVTTTTISSTDSTIMTATAAADMNHQTSRILEYRRGSMYDAHDIHEADLVIMETMVPCEALLDLKSLIDRMSVGCRLATFANLNAPEFRRLYPGSRYFPLRQLSVNVSRRDRFKTSWSPENGHHFYLWQKIG
jgi:Histone methylation protein DOT1